MRNCVAGIPKAAISMTVSMAISMVCAAALFTACMPAESRAGFLYVPPGNTAAVAESGEDREAATQQGTGSEAGHGSRRVPGRSPAAQPVPGSPERPGFRQADAEPPERRAAAGPWQVHPGEMLREVLDRWGGRAGVGILFLTDRRYRLLEGRSFGGSFEESTQALLSALSHLPHRPVGEPRGAGRTLAVLHGTRPNRLVPAGDDR